MSESMKQTNDRLVQDNVDLKCEAEGKDARIAELEAELRILQNTDAAKFAVAMHERAEQAEAERELLVEWIVTQYDVPEENVRTLLVERITS